MLSAAVCGCLVLWQPGVPPTAPPSDSERSAVPVQRPGADASDPASDSSQQSAVPDPETPAEDAGDPPVPTSAPAAHEPPAAESAPTTATEVVPDAAPETDSAPLSADLLAPPAEAEPLPASTTASDPGTEATVVSAYRPVQNPTRFNFVAHAMFANVGLHRTAGAGGRVGGASVDAGVTWNPVGVAVTGSVYGGIVGLEGQNDFNVFAGGGPTLSLGRLALLGRGIIDLRAGYDFFLATGKHESGQSIRATPHGPRVRLSLGLMADRGRKSRFWHAAGLTIGWQGFVADFSDTMPLASMLTLGLTYWLG